jgi:hypothetical protein
MSSAIEPEIFFLSVTGFLLGYLGLYPAQKPFVFKYRGMPYVEGRGQRHGTDQ